MMSNTLSPYRFYYHQSTSSPSSSSEAGSPSSPNDVIFGSLQVDVNSPTPYTDATQVGRAMTTVYMFIELTKEGRFGILLFLMDLTAWQKNVG